MKGHGIPNRRSGVLIVVCLVGVVVGTTSLLVNGPTGLAWGLGWGLTASLGWALLCNTRLGLMQGLSAGLFAGVNLGGLFPGQLKLLGGIVLAGLFWGMLGGIAAMLMDRSVRRIGFGGFAALNFPGALIIGVLGTIVVGLIGGVLEGFSLSAAGFVIGVVFLSPCWAFWNTVGIVIGHFLLLDRQPNHVRS